MNTASPSQAPPGSTVFLVLFLFLQASTFTAAAQPAGAFETLELHALGAANVNRTFLHTLWRARPGAGLSAETPFYLGRIEVGGAWQRFAAATPTVPRFDALLLYLGWGFRWRLSRSLSWQNTVRLGNYRMTFDEQTFSGVRNESETAVGFAAGLDLRLLRSLGLRVGGHYMKAFTFRRLHLFHVEVGLSYSLKTPEWLKTVLQ